MKSAFQQAVKRPKSQPKNWRSNTTKCRLRILPLRYRGYLVFFCTKSTHYHGDWNGTVKTIREEDWMVPPEYLYEQMVKSNG